MKKLIVLTFVYVIAALLTFTGCKPKPEHQFTEKDADKIAAWDKFFTPNPKYSNPFDRPVCAALVDPCVQRYRDIYGKKPAKGLNVDVIAASYTCSAGFDISSIQDWLLDIGSKTNVAQIEVRFGMYTQAIIDASGGQLTQDKLDRVTVFLYPVDDKGNLAVYTKDSTYTPIESVVCTVAGVKASAKTGEVTTPFNFANLQP